jgi:hypothetical protein
VGRDLQCEICTELWREYAAALFRHLRIESELQVAALAHDEDDVRVLAPKVENADAARSFAREAIRQHEADAHPSDGLVST